MRSTFSANRCRLVGITAALLLGGLRSPGAAPAPPRWWGPNIFPNPGCELVDEKSVPSGWRQESPAPGAMRLGVAADACGGARCLSWERVPGTIAPEADRPTYLFSPAVSATPGWYLLSFWYRYDFPPHTNPYRLVVVRRLAGERVDDTIYHYYFNGPAVSGAWAQSFLLFRIREGQTGVDLCFGYRGDRSTRLSLDVFQLRRLLVPETKHAVLTSDISDGYGADLVADPAATRGRAWRVEEGKQPAGSKTGGGTRFAESPGLYRGTFRCLQERPGAAPALEVLLGGDGGQTFEPIRPTDFARNGVYQDFTVYWFYPFGQGSSFVWAWHGKGAYRFDRLRLERLAPVSMPAAWNLLMAGVDLDRLTPPDRRAVAKKARVWMAVGPQADLFNIDETVAGMKLPLDKAWLQTVPGGSLELAPALNETALREARLVILADVPARVFEARTQYGLERFVARGGGLVICGNLFGFGPGGYAGTFLEELLPVRIRRTFDLVRLPPRGWPVRQRQ